jgi:hypothetical protein
MKSPVVVVAITLTAAILVAASLLIVTGVRKSSGTLTQVPALHQRWRHASASTEVLSDREASLIRHAMST